MYTEKTELTPETAVEIVSKCQTDIDLPKLKEISEKYIDESLSVQNIANVFSLADKLKNDKLMKFLIEYATKNFELKKK